MSSCLEKVISFLFQAAHMSARTRVAYPSLGKTDEQLSTSYKTVQVN